MKAHSKNDGLKTEKQWNMENMKLKEDAIGKECWTNRYCGQIATYYSDSEVEEMTQEDIEEYKKQKRNINKLRREEYEKNKRQELIEIGEERGIKIGKKAQFLEDLESFGYRLAMIRVKIDRDVTYYDWDFKSTYYKQFSENLYIIPKNILAGYIGKFPYGNDIVEGTVLEEDEKIKEEILKMQNEYWFPDKVKMMIIE